MFRITSGKGFHMEFDNGVCVSVQFGAGNYCENRERLDTYPFKRETSGDLECANAEIALWYASGKWATRDAWRELFGEELNDDVNGWCTPEQVARVIAWASTQVVPNQAPAEA